MKSNVLLVLLAGTALFLSCGTMSKTALNESSGFMNGIYYTPDKQQISEYNQAKASLKELHNQTADYLDKRSENLNYTSKGITQTIFVGDTNVIDIDYNPNYTYSIVDDDESYEARLRKFDSPVYTINIEWNEPYYNDAWYNPWWGRHHFWGSSSWYWHNRHHSFWHNPWYCGGWYDPWYCGGWYDPWYYGGWYDPWYHGGWYGPSWWHPHYGHGWNPMPLPPHRQPSKNIYYGKRESKPSYNRIEPNISQIRGNRGSNQMSGNAVSATNNGTNRSGSIYRRGGNSSHNGAIYSNAASQTGDKNSNAAVTQGNRKPASSQGSMYRRSSTQNTRQSATATTGSGKEQQHYNNTRNSNTGNSYYRNSSTSDYSRSSSYGNGNSTSRSSGGNHNPGRSGGGSSYRR